MDLNTTIPLAIAAAFLAEAKRFEEREEGDREIKC